MSRHDEAPFFPIPPAVADPRADRRSYALALCFYDVKNSVA